MKKFGASLIISIFSLVSGGYLSAEEPLKITTTLSTFADLAKIIGGEFVEVKSVASPRFNPHFIEPKPSDVLKVKKSDLFIHGGLDLEVWRAPLLDAAARADLRAGGDRQLDLSIGINLLEVAGAPVSRAEGDIHMLGNPHYWLDPRNGLIMAEAIAKKLAQIDPLHEAFFEKNLLTFSRQLQEKIEIWNSTMLPFRGQELIGYHNEWVYLMSFLGLKMEHFLEPKPGVPPSPKQIEFLVDYIKRNDIKGIIQASFYSTEPGRNLEERTGSRLLLLCQNVQEIEECSDYIKMTEYNIGKIVQVLKKERP